MAVDGSFCLEVELQKFLARCPKLASIPYLNDLQKKGEQLKEKEVVNAVVGVFLHPNYTIPLVGCFRPIAQKIVEQVVYSLHMVPNLRSDNDDSRGTFDEDLFLGEWENSENAEVINLIEYYVRSGKGLRLHELACLAFCRSLDLVPTLIGPLVNYFKIAPPPYGRIERIIRGGSVSKALSTGSTQILNVIRTSYRFLVLEPENFTRLWDWSCFLDLVQQTADLEPCKEIVLKNNVSDIRWCGIQILLVVLKLSFKATTKFNLHPREAFQSWLRWQEFCMDVSMEKAGWYLESSVDGNTASISKCTQFKSVPCRRSRLETCKSGSPFILTSAVKKSFEMVTIAVSQRWPVLLYGPAGAGKTSLISKLAGDLGKRVISIHMDEQMDGKALIGSYVSTEQPGEFRWQPGSLTQAVSNGFWVVFEDLDKAPPDIQSILLPLLEGSTTFLTSHGEGVNVNESFRLFSTVTSSKLDTSHFTEGRSSIGAIWRKIRIGPLNTDDLVNIVIARNQNLEPLAEKLVETFERVNQLTKVKFGVVPSSSCHGRFSLRDHLKLCKRISGLNVFFHGDELSASSSDDIYKEAIDIFASFSTSAENRLAIMKEIAKLWSVSAAETLFPANRPTIQDLHSDFQVGRVTLKKVALKKTEKKARLPSQEKPFVEIRSSVNVLEKIACSIKFNEPVLLVGETGTGKTTLVQSLALKLRQKLTVLNLSQQSDVADLLGGFKPIEARFICNLLYNEFEHLFTQTFSFKDNEVFLTNLRKLQTGNKWKKLLGGFQKGVQKTMEIRNSSSRKKRKRPLSVELLKAWENFSVKLERACKQVSALAGVAFQFVEGAFITALRNGEWILLDEVNLAPPEILQRVIGVLEEEKGSLCLAERGDVANVCRHSNFRIFACMNPATDAGKRDLPFSLRSRFTEYFVDDVLDDEDLILFINQFIDKDHSDGELVSRIVQFYKEAKKKSEETLQDGANQRPQYSLRSLYRALEYTKEAKGRFGFEKSFYDGFCLLFLTLLDKPSAESMRTLISRRFFQDEIPEEVPFESYLKVKGNPMSHDNYVVTRSIEEHLKNMSRAIFIGRYPVLLQGPTSSGKTSLVKYLATVTGHQFLRINNHQHTDLQDYLGSYVTDASGKLVFQEGPLVKAVRNGYWIVLDELNLAPSDVLEALNRLLDDNRELFVLELNERICAHPDFMLFATQNPPTVYGGRKMLSRAFRNRFIEVHVDEIPQEELGAILDRKFKIKGSRSPKMVNVMKELQSHRQRSKIFAGKHGFITPRDLFRWADRFRTSGKDLAHDGYYLMAERLRDDSEKIIVKDVLERQLQVNLTEDDLYMQEPECRDRALTGEKYFLADSKDMGKIIWTKSMWRTYFLIKRCYSMREPVLLVGETGGGKTTVCQLLSLILGSKLHILNCHQFTETSDFLGGFYPVRERSTIASDFQNKCEKLMQTKTLIHFPGDAYISTDINQASVTLDKLSLIISSYRQGQVFHADVTAQGLDYIEQETMELAQLLQKWQTIFTWQDGPLVKAMKNGDLFLVDEISLADDSVLERLNSVLEPERKLTLAEKGGSELESIIAHPNFFLLATMNPGGDYGKKELSPALRNRFTEIWVPSVSDANELKSIALQRILNPKIAGIVEPMLNFWEWFNNLQTGRLLTVRDLLSWVSFINITEGSLQAEPAFLHGAFLVLLDGLSLGSNISKSDAAELRMKCLTFLLEYNHTIDYSNFSNLESYGWANLGSSTVSMSADVMQLDDVFGIHPFYIERGADTVDAKGFEFIAPTTHRNALRVLRAMQLSKPVLLEGSPGVGKTSLIVALGKYSGHTVVRINLSEQTDIMDLLGSDLPVESDEEIQFAWSDGILLQAIKQGSWVLLDELNLAPQSVLEGLNAILDHRAEAFIPELGRSFKCPKSFRVFACQNPSYQGGGRKGLPKSFLNRFTKVYVDELVEEDYLSICSSLYPKIPRTVLDKLVLFNRRLHEDTMVYHKFGQDGSPWEFNLRDVIRSCQIIKGSRASDNSKLDCVLSTVYLQRMRTPSDRREVVKLYAEVFGRYPFVNLQPRVQLDPYFVTIGNISIERNCYQPFVVSNNELNILPSSRHSLEAAAQCVKHNWLCILVGPPSSGKTSLIRLLAQVTGNVLNELNLSSATDISELIGCFEQHNSFRDYQLAIARVESYLNEYCSLQLESSLEVFCQRKELITRWLSFLSDVECGPSVGSMEKDLEKSRMRYFKSIPKLVEIIKILMSNDDTYSPCISWSQRNLESTLNTLKKLEEDYQRRRYSVKFEWVTGLLIKAIENGEWIVLKNANLCNPTVLDRINSLVEQSGSITINECGSVDGKPVVLHPHPQFRMFLTVNPQYGEVSRAMRNRGVEIHVMQNWVLDKKYSESLDDTEFRDVKRFVTLSGIPVGRLVDMMAKAHIFAKHEGAHLDVNITYLELARWVQLFKRLVTNGNQPTWSLQISWEHTYLSSLGEGEGKDIVARAVVSYLSSSELGKLPSAEDGSLGLPGGWPMPLKLRDFVCHSKEACVRQNCMFLESLGAQVACQSFVNILRSRKVEKNLLARCPAKIYLMEVRLLRATMFPKASNDLLANYGMDNKYDLVLAKKKLLFAANWAIEQATESEYCLYLNWFKWLGSQFQSFCSFFNWFPGFLEKEMENSIWNRILQLRRELKSLSSTETDFTSRPTLSMELVDAIASVDMLSSCYGRSLQQWSQETEYSYDFGTPQCFEHVLSLLRGVEQKVLLLIVELPAFDRLLCRSYNGLLEHHILFWNGIISSPEDKDCLLISWRSLMKDAIKLREFCPEEVERFQIEMKNLPGVLSLSFNSQKSLLWAHGGHPSLPMSADLYRKQIQLSNLCDLVWPRKTKFWELAASEQNEISIDASLSSNSELRFLAMQGILKSSYIDGKADDEDFTDPQHVEEMYQTLLRSVDFEKQKLTDIAGKAKHTSSPIVSTVCCVFSPDILCRRSGVDCWLQSLPISDETSLFLDLGLLHHLTKITLVNTEEQHHVFSNLSGLLQSTLDFSLNFSSRPPTDLLPHQKILRTLDALASGHTANEKISSYVLEMWFRWHTTLWEPCYPQTDTLGGHDGLPHKLFLPSKMTTIDQMLQNQYSIRDYSLHSFKLRVYFRSLWQSSENMNHAQDLLLSAAQSLFEQIVYAHKKSFEDAKFDKIKSAFKSIKELKNKVTAGKYEALFSLLASSNHPDFASLIDTFVDPLLRELYPHIVQSLGYAWLRIGWLRYNLLTCDDLDPAVKYSTKYSQLKEKITSLEIEIQVRKECAHLSGTTEKEADDKVKLLESLNAEEIRLRRKVSFRSDRRKYGELKLECDDFLDQVPILVSWVMNVESMQMEEVINRLKNWQETASSFIEQLSNKYPSYIDIVQPIQVAIYEMKFGLSLILSGLLHKKYLEKIEAQDMELVMGTIHSFMRFPRGCAARTVSVVCSNQAKLLSSDVELPTSIDSIHLNLLEKICRMGSTMQLRISMYENVLTQIKHSIADACFLDNATFKLLDDEIFDKFAREWMHMKLKTEKREENQAQQFKFKTRAFNIENIIKVDISNLANLLPNESFSEWQEMLSQEHVEKTKADEEHENMEDDWDSTVETDLNNLVQVHNQLFGSIDLFQNPGSIHVSDSDRLSSFLGSYTLGVKMMKDLKGLFASRFDAKVTPEHLLRLCMEHQKFNLSQKSADTDNFYKDSNSSEMVKLVERIMNLKQRILVLLNEWDDHPALQKILDTIEMLLALPLSTPLAKALSGLHFLLNSVRGVQETVAKFPLSDELDPILLLVSKWHKLEFESWPALLDEVQFQFEMSAGKLWFPLYSVLRPRDATEYNNSTIQRHADIDEYNHSTIQSLEEFVQMSSIGEFRKRLQLLHAFHGQISNGLSRGFSSSPWDEENEKILYNIFGFYVQFLPLILEQIEAHRRNIETELKEVNNLCQWDRVEVHWTLETSRKQRLRLRKIIQKYNELLQQPFMHFLAQEASRRVTNAQSIQGLNLLIDPYEKSRNLLTTICSKMQSAYKDSSLCVTNWWKNVVVVLQRLHLGGTSEVDLSDVLSKDIMEDYSKVRNVFKDDVTSKSYYLYLEEKRLVQHASEEICGMLIDCVQLWEEKSKNLRKRRAFSELLKLLDSSGLLKHRTSKSRSCLLQPSYDIQHLLLSNGSQSSGDSSSHQHLEIVWKTANQYYFKSIASVEALQKICLKFHRDFTLEQVKRSSSYVDHLVEIQREQRALAYDFANQLRSLKECTWPLSNLFSSSISSASGTTSDFCFTQNQHATFQCMWKQKQIFDGFYTMLYGERLLLQVVENHLKNCLIVKDEVQSMHQFIQKFFPDFQKSKEMLDHYLLPGGRDITAVGAVLSPYGVTVEMEQLVNHNFQLIREFQDSLSSFRKQYNNRAVQEILLGHFTDLFEKADIAAEEFTSLRARNLSNCMNEDPNHCEGNVIEVKSCFINALKETYKHILDALQRVGYLKNDHSTSVESLKNMNEWKVRFERDIGNLQLNNICHSLLETIQFSGQLLNYYGERNPSVCSSIAEHLRQLYSLLDVVMAFGDNLLHDFLTMHGTVSTMTCVLTNVFATLFANGFGTTEDQSNGDEEGKTQDVHGTGMGEGAGLNDVSDQITDEDQLLGASQKPHEEKDDSSNVPSKNEKGIEMDEDFCADAFSVSEDSGDDENDDADDEQLDSAMGETGLNSEIVDEKTGDLGNDENPNNMNEKYETGPPVKDTACNDKQLRAREDFAADVYDHDDDLNDDDDGGDGDLQKNSDEVDVNGDELGPDDIEDMHVDKADAFSDPTGLNPDDQNPGTEEDVHRDDMDVTEDMEEGEPEDLGGSEHNDKNKEQDDLMDESLEEVEHEKLGENAEVANAQENNLQTSKEMDFKGPTKDAIYPTTSDFCANNVPNAESAPESMGHTDTADQGEVGCPSDSGMDVIVAEPLGGKRLSLNQSQSKMPPFKSQNRLNPCRSVGDALDGCKEGVKVSVDLQDQTDGPDDLVGDNADEYGYTAEFEKGTAQALGPATLDQIDRNVNQSEQERDMGTADLKDTTTEMDIDMQLSDIHPVRAAALNPDSAVENQFKVSESDNQVEESTQVDVDRDINNLSESILSVNRSYMTEDRISKLEMLDEELGNAPGFEISTDMRDNGAALWRKYELLTSRLSQELAEQLRLVMEPTLASKLQGDYKTGKRINMKKVIQYIASHYRKDKIWLRRTRPNKRDYQVVIAVDDSRSMSENRCGEVAVEALVTVCRAMSQLEVGKFAVASFGQQGNVRLLHDFDQPFTGDAGIKMISSLTFKQETTIRDSPIADLLKYLNNMLDSAVMNARLPSGFNPLQQLVLIISDGLFVERGYLKSYVREMLSQKRMVACVLIDNPKQPISDLMEITSLEGRTVKKSRCLDSFPFPFYIILKKVEDLPRALADLLRQWFELMQHWRD